MRIFKLFFAILALMFIFQLNAFAQDSHNLIQSVQYDEQSQTIKVFSSAVIDPQIQYLSDSLPGKIVIDINQAVFQKVKQEITVSHHRIQKIRVGQFQNKPPVVRLVLDLLQPTSVSVHSVVSAKGFETNIELLQHSPTETTPNYRNAKPQLLDLRLVGQNLVLEANSAVYPEVRQLNKDKNEYLLSLYDFTTPLDGFLPKIKSSLIESATVLSDAKGVQIKIRLTRNDIEIIPFTEERFCTLQFLVKANEQNFAKFNDIQIDEMDSQTTRVRIFSDKLFDYQIYPLENPHRLVIDTLGTIIGKDNLEKKLSKNRNIRGIRLIATQAERQTDIRIVLDLNGEVIYQFDAQKNYLELILKGKNPIQEPSASPKPGNIRAFVVLDPGHGGNDPGALGQKKNQEKVVTLAVSQYLAQYLAEDNIQVVLTRQEDLEVLLQPRVDVANLRHADLFVSVHCNSMPPNNTHVRGIETYYTTPQSLDLANTLHKYLVNELGAIDRRVRKRGLFVTRKTSMPSVLLEIGFLSNSEEEQLLSNPGYQRRVAKAIRDGIYDYLSRNQKLKPLL